MADAITHGADTEALRAHSRSTASGARRLDDLLATLAPLVASCPWEGADAEAFRADWHRTAEQMSSSRSRLSEASTTLTEEADQQDRASAPEGLASLLISSIGRDLATMIDRGGDQLGTGTWWSGLLGHGGEASTLMGARVAEDDFDHERGKGGETTITLPDGSKITLGDDGTQMVKLDGTTTIETEMRTPDGTVTASVRVGDTMEVTETPDGKLTYTFTGLAEYGSFGQAEGGAFGGEGSTSGKVEQVYSVTVPKGTDAAEAMQINPFDPSSIPPGASVSTGTGVEEKSSLSVSGEYRGFELGLGGTVAEGNSQSLTIARDESTGNLSMLEGPTEMTADGATVDLGRGDVKFSMGQETIEKTEVLEYSEFGGDGAGTAAYLNAMHNGMPEDASSAGVEDRYRQTHTSSLIEDGFEFGHEDVLTIGRKHVGYSDELIVRDYPDGSQEFAQQILPHGESSNNSVTVEGGTGRETSYTMTLGDVERTPAMTDLLGNAYGQFQRGEDLSISMSQEELSVMADNRATWHGNPRQYENETDYLTGVVASDSQHGARRTVEEMVRDYNYRPGEAGSWRGAERVHPEIKGPGMVIG